MTAMPHATRERQQLEQLARALSRVESVEAAAELLATWSRELTGSEAVTVRVCAEDDSGATWLPVCAQAGHDPDHLKDEASIPLGSCLCGTVAAGRRPANPFFSEGGSFSWGRSQSLPDSPASAHVGPLRGRCIAAGFESIAVVPMRDAGREVGVIHLADRKPDRFNGALDALEAAGLLAGATVASLEDRRRHPAQAFLEAALLPAEPPEIDGLELGVSFVTASTFSQFGGDFYEAILRSDGSAFIVVGDYSGRGVRAAGMAAEVRRIMARLADVAEGPAELLGETNRALGDWAGTGAFATAVACFLHPGSGRLQLSLAGHAPPLVLNGSGRATELEAPFALPLGVAETAAYRPAELHLEPGQTLLLFTDGVTEARRGGELFGVEGITAACDPIAQGAQALATAICASSSGYHDPALSPDDRLILAVRLDPPEPLLR